MDERKRERSHIENSEPKRFRPEEIIGPGDNGRVITRLLVNKDEFSRLIGKGGATISLIRNSTGVTLKGSDVDEDHRLVLISGYLDAVLKAFDLVSELLEQSAKFSPDAAADSDSSRGVFAVHILLEHGKAGKAVGAKGAMMESIKRKSAVQNLRIEKEPKDFSGVLLRNLTVDGSLASIRRAHFHLLELFYGGNGASFSQQGSGGFGSAAAGYGSLEFSGSAAAAAAAQHNFSAGGSSHIAPVLNLRQASQQQQHLLGSMGGGSVPASAFVPFPALVEVGVQPETVHQLVEMKAYLQRHFNLNLCCTRDDPAGSSSTATMHPPASNAFSASSRHHPTIDAALAAKKEASANKVSKNAAEGNAVQEISFAIPKSIAGGLIGKGAQGIKDLQEEFPGAKVHVEREEIEGQRIVVLFHQQLASNLAEGSDFLPSAQVSSLLDNLKAKILANVEALLEEQQAGSGSMEGSTA